MSSDSHLTRQHLRELGLDSIHRTRNLGKADVSRVQWPADSAQWVVVKDLRARPWWYRVLWGRFGLKREWKALAALKGIEGIPRPVARVDADAFAMEWHPGKPAVQWKKGTIPVAALERASQILEGAHARGVTHGDLHSHNILISEAGEVTLLDWATASVFGTSRLGLKKVTFNEWKTLDLRGIAKLKARHAPQILTPRDQQALTYGSPISRLIRTGGFYFRRALGMRPGKPPQEAAARYTRMIEKQAQREKESL